MVYEIIIKPTQKMSQNLSNLVSFFVFNPRAPPRSIIKDPFLGVEFQDKTFGVHEKFVADCPTGQIGDQILKSRFYSRIFQKNRKNSTSLKSVLTTLQPPIISFMVPSAI